ncbi:hypothetical protein DBR43_24360 [Pedobacter sp. KBW06]|nr:hypothetical protein DBR43_24360 [Pedobacter sp. KBW06]
MFIAFCNRYAYDGFIVYIWFCLGVWLRILSIFKLILSAYKQCFFYYAVLKEYVRGTLAIFIPWIGLSTADDTEKNSVLQKTTSFY